MSPLIFVTIIASLVYCGEAFSCPEKCIPENCVKPVNCYKEIYKEQCGCCDVCARGPGEKCGGIWNMGGHCSKGLVCIPHPEYEDLFGTCSTPPRV